MQEQQAAFLVPWLEDETVFSLASRLHKLWGYPLAGSATQILFGHHQKGSQHDFPTRLTEFAQTTRGLLGSATEIAKTHTLYQYYRIFLDEPERQDFVDALCGHSLTHFKLRLGLLTICFRSNHPQKLVRSACKQMWDLKSAPKPTCTILFESHTFHTNLYLI